MAIHLSDASGPIKWPKTDNHDPQSKKYYFLTYRPNQWEPGTEYVKDSGVVVPLLGNGCLYVCVQSGISGGTEPVWSTQTGKIITDGTTKWKVTIDTSILRPGDEITSSTWTASEGVTLNATTLGTILNNRITAVRVDSVDPTLTSFSITNTVTITRSTFLPVSTEEYERTIIIPVKNI